MFHHHSTLKTSAEQDESYDMKYHQTERVQIYGLVSSVKFQLVKDFISTLKSQPKASTSVSRIS